jgi:hypothetical protein
MLQSLLLPFVNLGRMNAVFGRNLVDRLVSRDGLNGYTRLKLTGMLPSMCHNSLLSEATIPQRHYLIYWPEKVGVLYSKGDKALFGGKTTRQMKDRLDVPQGRPLADFLPTITIKAKDFANEITNYNIKQHNLGTEGIITSEHVKNNEEIRKLLRDRGIVPERLPPAEDAKKIERRLKSEEKKLPKGTGKLSLP